MAEPPVLLKSKASDNPFTVEKSIKEELDATLNKNFENFCYIESFVRHEIKNAGLKCITMTQTTIKNEVGAFLCICIK